MSKQQRDAIDAALRAEPFGINQSTDGRPNRDRSAPLASPVFATLAGLPPLLIQVGSHEVLLDDAVRLAANAGRDDVDVTLQVAPEGTHVFQLHFGALDEADEAIDEVARFFTRHLS